MQNSPIIGMRHHFPALCEQPCDHHLVFGASRSINRVVATPQRMQERLRTQWNEPYADPFTSCGALSAPRRVIAGAPWLPRAGCLGYRLKVLPVERDIIHALATVVVP